MNRRFVVIAIAALVFAAVVGGIAYNFGVANGIEHSGKIVAAPGQAPQPYYWYHPWGFGFPFFFPLFFLLLFIAFIVRGLFGRGHYRHGYGCGPEGRFDEWHRRAHERMTEPPRQ